jgi:hypothetical protein
VSPSFNLIVKHHEFTVFADRLTEHFPVFAVVRHPLAALASWQTVDMPIYHGHLISAEVFDAELTARLAAEPDRIRRQVVLMEWLLQSYSRFPRDRILRYEDLMAAPRQHLARFSAKARDPGRALRAYDPARRYPGIDLAILAEALLPLAPVAETFYPGIEESLAPWLRTKSFRMAR